MIMRTPLPLLLVVLLLSFTPSPSANHTSVPKYIDVASPAMRSGNDSVMKFTGNYDILSAQGNFTMTASFSNSTVDISATVLSAAGSIGDYYSSSFVSNGRINLTVKGKVYEMPDIFHLDATVNTTYNLVLEREVKIGWSGNKNGYRVYSSGDGTTVRMFDPAGSLIYLLDRTPMGFVEMTEIQVKEDISYLHTVESDSGWLLRYDTMAKMEGTEWNSMAPDRLGLELAHMFNGSRDSIITAAALAAHSYAAVPAGPQHNRCEFMLKVLSGAGIEGDIEVVTVNNSNVFVVNISGVLVDPVSMILPYGATGLETGNYSAYEGCGFLPDLLTAITSGSRPVDAAVGTPESAEGEDYFAVLFAGFVLVSFAFTVFTLLIVLTRYSRAGLLPKKTGTLAALVALAPGIYALLLADGAGAYLLLTVTEMLAFIFGALAAITLAYIIFIRGIK